MEPNARACDDGRSIVLRAASNPTQRPILNTITGCEQAPGAITASKSGANFSEMLQNDNSSRSVSPLATIKTAEPNHPEPEAVAEFVLVSESQNLG